LTWQGEGPSLGRKCSFIRLGGCNLHCAWCDTPFTWDAARFDLREQITNRPVAEVVEQVESHGTSMVVVTGGEPLLHQHRPGWVALIRRLRDRGFRIEVETNGTRAPTAQTGNDVTEFNVSPKLAHAGDPEGLRINRAALTDLVRGGKAVFKFVVAEIAQLDEVAAICKLAGIPHGRVWIMPEGTDAATVTARARLLADPVLARGWNMTTRLHVLIWGDERGR
jgi:7-carboxy-7-deazaguanine synthase